jgi:hypothetical protein
MKSWERDALIYGSGLAFALSQRQGQLRSWALWLSAGGLAKTAYVWAKEQKLFSYPELMNGYFKTGGKLSAVRSEQERKALAARQERQQAHPRGGR